MAKTFGITQNNDLFIDNFGNLTIHSGLLAVLNACKNAAQTLLGEMIYQTNQGMPNFQVIWNGNANIPQFRAALIQTLKAVPGVVEVQDIETQVKNNVLEYTAFIVTEFGAERITNVQ